MISQNLFAQQWDGDQNTSSFIYRTGNVTIGANTPQNYKLYIGGTSRITNAVFLATSSGNVGIGTTTTSQKLDVNGNIQLRGGTRNLLFTGGDGYIRASDSSKNLFFQTGGENTRLTILGENGNVGIGTITPDEKLHVYGKLKIENNSDSHKSIDIFCYGNSTAWITGWGKAFFNDRVGIGTTEPSERLEVIGNIQLKGNMTSINFKQGDATIKTTDLNKHIYFKTGNQNTRMIIRGDTVAVGIGVIEIPVGYKLAVAGKIITEEVLVKLQSNWPDYVFQPDYHLRTLQEVEEHITTHGHLPEVPNAQTVEENGIGVGEMNAILLKKIEELTLYVIELKKENVELREMILNVKH